MAFRLRRTYYLLDYKDASFVEALLATAGVRLAGNFEAGDGKSNLPG